MGFSAETGRGVAAVDYLGGHPALPRKETDVGLEAAPGGGVKLARTTYANMLRGEQVLLTVGADELLAISVGNPGQLKSAIGGLVPVQGFDLGLGMAFRGKTAILIAATVDGGRAVMAFDAPDDRQARKFLASVQQERAKAGLDAVPTIEAEVTHRSAREQATSLNDIGQLLRNQQQLLERIADRLDRLPG